MKLFYQFYIPILLIPKKGTIFGFNAYNFGLIIICNKDYIDQDWLVQHELLHSRQFLKTFGLHMIMYYFSKKYRYKAELDAYKISIKYGLPPNSAAEMIYKNYGVECTKELILFDLTK